MHIIGTGISPRCSGMSTSAICFLVFSLFARGCESVVEGITCLITKLRTLNNGVVCKQIKY